MDILLTRGQFLIRNNNILMEKARRSSSESSEPPAKVVKESNKNQQSSRGKTGTVGKYDSQKDLRNKISEISHGKTGPQGKNISRTFTNTALANKRDLSAKEGKKNLGYADSRNSSNQAKKNLPCSSKGSSSTSGKKDLGSKKTKEYSRSGSGKVSTVHLICKMDRGEEITCIQNDCNRAVTRASQYKCQNCKMDNLGTLHKRKLRESLDTFKVPNPLFDTAEYKVPKKSQHKK